MCGRNVAVSMILKRALSAFNVLNYISMKAYYKHSNDLSLIIIREYIRGLRKQPSNVGRHNHNKSDSNKFTDSREIEKFQLSTNRNFPKHNSDFCFFSGTFISTLLQFFYLKRKGRIHFPLVLLLPLPTPVFSSMK